MKIEIEIEDEKIDDTLCSAFEGGSNYWCKRISARGEGTRAPRWAHQVPMAGGWLELECHDANDPKPARLDRAALERGIKIMAQRYAKHFGDMVDNAGDATTGDVLLQLSVFGEVIFG